MEAAHFFEGTEKLLEVWFSRQQPDANQGSGDLRTIPRWVQGALPTVSAGAVAASKIQTTGVSRGRFRRLQVGAGPPPGVAWAQWRGTSELRHGRIHAGAEPVSPAAVGPGLPGARGEAAACSGNVRGGRRRSGRFGARASDFASG